MRLLDRTKRWLDEHPFTFLLGALVTMMMVGPLVSALDWSVVLNRVTMTVVFVTAMSTMIGFRRVLIAGLILVGLTVLTTWLTMGFYQRSIVLADHLTTIAFLALIIGASARIISRRGTVTSDAIRGAVCIYLLLGFLFAVVYSLIQYVDPDAIDIGDVHGVEATECILGGSYFHYLIYFSFITQTTLGYGDILPRSEPAQAVAVFQACAGPLFLAVTIARLVGMELAERQSRA